MNIKRKIKILLYITTWICSLYFVWFATNEGCEQVCHIKVRRAYENGLCKAERAVSKSLFVPDSLWASQYLGVDVLDTYFAKGSTLKDLLIDAISSEGITARSYFHHPEVKICIDGCAEYVSVNLQMYRPAYLEVSDSREIRRHDKSWGSEDEYYGDIFIQDYINCYDEIKKFPKSTQYDEIAEWLQSRLKDICSKIKEKNRVVIKLINERYTMEKEKGLDRSYRFNPSCL
ncbi:MAG: hypothetical protein ACH350_10220 [Parachlamydiaceae bacterium]